MDKPSIPYLQSLFTYHDIPYGALEWKVGRLKGELAGTITGDPEELRVRIDGKSYLAAKVVWALTMGHWPEGRLKFEDNDRTNIQIDNLTELDRADGPGR